MNKTREQILAEHISEDHRVQYDSEDTARLESVADLLTNASMLLIEALAKYRDASIAEVNEDSADLMKQARYDLIFTWTMVQTAVSKVAWVTRFDGEEAYKRAVETMAANPENFPIFSDL